MKECTDYKRNQANQPRLATKCSGYYNRHVCMYPVVGGHREVMIPAGPESWARTIRGSLPPPPTPPLYLEYMFYPPFSL